MLQHIRKLNEGSLLQRTLLHVAVAAVGSASVVALTSVLLVSTAQALLPPHDTTETGADEAEQERDAEQDADPSSPEAAAGTAGAKGGSKALSQVRVASRRDSTGVR